MLTTGSQGVHSHAHMIAKKVFKIEPSQLRVITPDVGGGFGPKGFVYREYPLVLEAAKRLGRPVKWAGDRTEHFLTDAHGRDNVVDGRDGAGRGRPLPGAARRSDRQYGRLYLAIRPAHPLYRRHRCRPASTTSPALDVTITGVYTNTCPVDAYRGAGPSRGGVPDREAGRRLRPRPRHRPAIEIRRRNFIRPEQFPYRHPDRPALRRRRVRRPHDAGHGRADWDELRRSGWRSRRRRGKIRGIGMATYIEACAFPGSEPAHVTLNGDGTVTLRIGTQTNGQGHATAYAQFVAEKLGIDIAKVNRPPGRYRPTAVGRRHRRLALDPARRRLGRARRRGPWPRRSRRIAADELEASAGRHRAGRRHGAHRRHRPRHRLCRRSPRRPSSRAISKASANSCRTSATYPNGTHICEVEIDPETGATEIVDLHDRRRFRRHGEPDPARRPGPWRRRAGHRPGA